MQIFYTVMALLVGMQAGVLLGSWAADYERREVARKRDFRKACDEWAKWQDKINTENDAV